MPLHADHSMMAKFDMPSAAWYRTALDKLRQFAKDAPAVVADRYTKLLCSRVFPCTNQGYIKHRRVTGLSHAPQCLFKKDLMFVGREIIISAITEKHAAIGKRHERVALVGLAGVLRLALPIGKGYLNCG